MTLWEILSHHIRYALWNANQQRRVRNLRYRGRQSEASGHTLQIPTRYYRLDRNLETRSTPLRLLYRIPDSSFHKSPIPRLASDRRQRPNSPFSRVPISTRDELATLIMDGRRDSRTAPFYAIPPRRLVSVEHPAVVQNLDKAVDTLQGNAGIDKVREPTELYMNSPFIPVHKQARSHADQTRS